MQANGGKIKTFTPKSWRVYNVPNKSYIVAQDADAVGNTAEDYENTESSIRFGEQTDNIYDFDFYMLENRKNAKTYEGRSIENYKQREEEVKTNEHKNTGEYKYVEPYATFVEIKAHMEIENADNDNGIRVADVTYVIHLGYVDSPSNYGLADTKPGDFKFKDVNGDGILDISDTDRAIVGNYMPDFAYGFGANIAWKGIDLGVIFQGVYGNEILNLSRRYFYNHEGNMNNYKGALDRWKSEDNPGSGMNVRANRVSKGQNGTTSTWHVEDGSYLRIKNISLGYTFPMSLVNKVCLQAARIYCSIQNPFTFTRYEGYNPEVSNRNSVTTNGEDYGVYPLARTISLGVNLTF